MMLPNGNSRLSKAERKLDVNTCIWITGRPGSGKTTLPDALCKIRPELIRFDADEVRSDMYPRLGYTDDDRWLNIRVLARLCATATLAGSDCVVAAVSPLKSHRQYARSRVESVGARFVEVQLVGRQRAMWRGTAYEEGVHHEHRFDTTDRNPEAMARDVAEQRLPRRPHQLFVGRWQPFHDGHEAIIREALASGPVAVGVRTTQIGPEDPHSVAERLAMIRARFVGEDVVAFAVPDIDSIHYGRDVGYRIVQHAAVRGVSGSEIRRSQQPPANQSSAAPEARDG